MTETKFVREFHHYWVLKMTDMLAVLSTEEMDTLIRLSDKVDEHRGRIGKKPFMCVVVEHDWPEYEPTWKAIEARVTENNHAHEDLPIHLETQRVGRQMEKLMKRGASLLEALEIVAKDARERAKRITE